MSSIFKISQYSFISLIILLHTVFLNIAFSQNINFNHLNVEDGLQNNIVFGVTQDQKGFMWFATMTGIDRYDGVRFEHYKIPANDLQKTEFSMVQFITCDQNGNIWATSSGSLLLYDQKSNTFISISSVQTKINKSENISSLFVGKDGYIWVGLNDGVILYQPISGKTFKLRKDDLQVRAFLEKTTNVIWIGTNKGINKVVFDKELKVVSDLEDIWTTFNKDNISKLSKDNFGRYWVGTLNKGLYVNEGNGKPFFEIPISKKSGRHFTIKDIVHDSRTNTHLVAADGDGVIVLSDQYKILNHFQTNEDNPNSLNNNGVYDIFIDKYAKIWLTTYGNGINYYFTKAQPFTTYRHEINNYNSLSNNMAKCIAEDENRNLWFGTRKGLSILKRKTLKWQHLNTENNSSFASDNVLSIIQDKGYMWVGTYGGGLMKISENNLQIKNYKSISGNVQSLGTDYIYVLLKDNSGLIWAGGIRGPISVLNPITEKFSQLDLKVDNINSLMQDSDGNIRVGTDKGIFILRTTIDSKNNIVIKNIRFINSVDKVYAILEDNNHFFWLATQGNGLLYVDTNGKIKRKITEENGLSSDITYGILKDLKGEIWVSTINGISHLQIGENLIVNYSQIDGLAGSQYNYGAFYETKSNEFIFGSTNGFTLFNPLKIWSLSIKSDLVFTDLLINEKKVQVDTINGPLFSQLDDLKILTLPNNQNSFSISFANLAPTISGKHLYSWKLEGFDSDWSPLSNSNKALYTNINPGSYTFLVRTFEKGQYNKNPTLRTVALYIEAPWWASKTAYFIYLLFLIALAYGIYQYYKIQFTRKKYADRLKLQTIIAHEIRTPLTLIKGPLNSLLNYKDLPIEYKNNLYLAKRNVDKLQNIITQFIDYQRMALNKVQMQVSLVNFSDFFNEIVVSFKHLSNEKGIELIYKNQDSETEILMDRDKMEKVFNNLISNAVKYTQEQGSIYIEVKRDIDNLIIVIKDNGIGIPEKQQRFIFKGFYRADNTVNLRETGSGIGLSIAKEMLALHKGKISLKSVNGQGSTFIVEIPIRNEELMVYLKAMESNHQKDDFALTSLPSNKIETPFKILVVEDNHDLRNYLIAELKGAGYCLEGAEDGREALDKMQQQSFDLVITDIMMPEINGFQLCTEIKKNINTCHIPVIMLTTIDDKDYLLEGYRSGADDYVQKPFDINYILTRVDNLLQNRLRFRNRIMSVFEAQDNNIKNDPELTWLKEITELIVDHMAEPEFSVEKLCSITAMSRSVLFRKFKALTSESPQHYINQLRLRKAVELLQDKSYNINEIAYSTGFSDPKYFSTAFKKHFGKSPRDYQKKL
jgi:signal transduction histidine kinase/ligand-binding sensor domain-containing protein/DNA-binding response OmpR family regulator